MISRYSERGQVIIELLFGAAVLVPIALSIVDITFVISGYSLNASVCRQAVRVASMGPPDAIEHGTPYASMTAVINQAASTTGAIQIQRKFLMAEHMQLPLPTRPFGGPVNGDISLITTVLINPPITAAMFHTKPLAFTYKQTYPYTWTMRETYLTRNSQANSEDQ